MKATDSRIPPFYIPHKTMQRQRFDVSTCLDTLPPPSNQSPMKITKVLTFINRAHDIPPPPSSKLIHKHLHLPTPSIAPALRFVAATKKKSPRPSPSRPPTPTGLHSVATSSASSPNESLCHCPLKAADRHPRHRSKAVFAFSNRSDPFSANVR